MNPRWTSPRLRAWVWMAGAALSVGCYFSAAIQLPRRTSTGVERRLFGLGDLTVKLIESPSGGRWLIVPADRDPTPPRRARSPLQRLGQSLRRFQVSLTAAGPRRLPLSVAPGTWILKGTTPFRVWSFAAHGWLDERRLWYSDQTNWP